MAGTRSISTSAAAAGPRDEHHGPFSSRRRPSSLAGTESEESNGVDDSAEKIRTQPAADADEPNGLQPHSPRHLLTVTSSPCVVGSRPFLPPSTAESDSCVSDQADHAAPRWTETDRDPDADPVGESASVPLLRSPSPAGSFALTDDHHAITTTTRPRTAVYYENETSAWRVRLHAAWLQSKGMAMVLLSQFFGASMNVMTQVLEVDGTHGRAMDPFQVSNSSSSSSSSSTLHGVE